MNILLAEDDIDDCLFFKNALEELQLPTQLTTVRDGEQLMNYLSENSSPEPGPDLLFLDLSMPRKNGFECLSDIKKNEKLKDIRVVVFTTSYTRDVYYEKDMINRLLKIGAFHFIRKTTDFTQLKQAIHHALTLVTKEIA